MRAQSGPEGSETLCIQTFILMNQRAPWPPTQLISQEDRPSPQPEDHLVSKQRNEKRSLNTDEDPEEKPGDRVVMSQAHAKGILGT